MEPPQIQINADYQTSLMEESTSEDVHPLYDNWTLWAHLPHDTDWTLKSYRKIARISSAEEAIALVNSVPDQMIKNCMLFLMRDGIIPLWEDPANKNGGCFSFKIGNKHIADIWRIVSQVIMGETISNDKKFLESVNGMTISPKRAFCILKLWMKDLDHQDPSKITDIENLSVHGCLFKRHTK
jgi:hypothetical protein